MRWVGDSGRRIGLKGLTSLTCIEHNDALAVDLINITSHQEQICCLKEARPLKATDIAIERLLSRPLLKVCLPQHSMITLLRDHKAHQVCGVVSLIGLRDHALASKPQREDE